jgi:hypothetical protein
LNSGAIGVDGHFPTKGIDLLHEMSFGNASDRRITGHLSDPVSLHGQQEGLCAHASGGKSGFAACMPASHDEYVKRT